MGAANSAGLRADIEGLRGIAILLVVAFHCGVPGFAGGFIGVDVFFVLSGYVITALLVREVEETSRLRVAQFYARRLRRLLPAAALMVAVTLSAGAVILAPHELIFAGRAARAAAFGVSNLFFAVNVADYFAPRVEANPLSHIWSLAVEEQFYLIWPVVVLLGLRVWRSPRGFVCLLGGLTLLSLGASVWLTATAPSMAFYGLPTRLWEFGIGGLAAVVPRRVLRLPPAAWLVTGWCALGGIVASAGLVSGESNVPGWMALAPVLSTAALLIAGPELCDRGTTLVLRLAPLQVCGALSYGWYLWHWPFLVFASALLPSLATAGKLVAAGGALAAAVATRHYVENPLHFHAKVARRSALSLGIAGMATAVSFGGALLSMRFAERLLAAPEMARLAQSLDDVAELSSRQCVNANTSSELKTCIFGDPGAARHVVLFGDSHALQWFNPVEHIARSQGWKLTTFFKTGCPAMDVTITRSGAQFAAACNAWRAAAIRRIVTLHPSLVVIGNATTYLARQGRRASRSDVSLADWQAGTARTVEALAATGLRIAVLRDTPAAPFDVPACLARSLLHSWYPASMCEMQRSVSVNQAIFDAERAGAAGLRNVRFIDLSDQLCDGDVCRAVQGSIIVYRNSSHLTGSFAASLQAPLEAKLVPIVNEKPILVAGAW